MRTASSTAARALTAGCSLSLLLSGLAGTADAAPRADGSTFSCRASAIRVVLKVPTATTVEPFVANAADSPCAADDAGLINPTTVGPVTAEVISAQTVQTPADLASAPPAEGDNATATTSVTNPAIALPGVAITASVLRATASYTCQNGQPVPGGAPLVANLVVNGTTVALPPNNAPLTVPLGPLGELRLNETVQEPNRITTRALFLTTPAADVIIAEATADIGGNPCAAAAKPECSDAVDNDGDGKIDPTDPGCLSGPGGTYDPNDNSERDTECSDIVDNDGDGKADATDPGCLSGPGGTYDPNDNSERDTECSDGRDNDGDGRIDFPDDRGCTSASDQRERTPAGTARLGSDPAAIARLGVNGPCVGRTFAARVTGRSISRVVFFLDGRRLRTVGDAPFQTRVSTSTPGRHTVRAQVTFLADSGTRARTLSFGFTRCAPRARYTG